MLEHVPRWLGGLLRNLRAGHAKLVVVQPGLVPADRRIELKSPAFADGARLPVRFTADGEGLSPPLLWTAPPAGTASFVLIVEDPDAPALSPLVHAIVWALPPDARNIEEGAIRADREGGPDSRDVGRNSFFSEGWLPPDPPTGHGAHDYVFQLFALSDAPDIGSNPGRSDVVQAIAGKVLAAGVLVGTYSRGEEALPRSGSGVIGVSA